MIGKENITGLGFYARLPPTTRPLGEYFNGVNIYLDNLLYNSHITPMGFEWDTGKEAINLAKHSVDFNQASQIFRGPVLEKKDTRRDYGEVRWVALGEYDECVLCVIYTRRKQDIRIISAWKAGKHDRKIYEEACREL